MPKRGRDNNEDTANRNILVGDSSSAIGGGTGGDAWLSKLKSGTNNNRGELRSSRRRAKERKTSTATNNNNKAKTSFSDIDFINQDEIWTTNTNAVGRGGKRNTTSTKRQTKKKSSGFTSARTSDGFPLEIIVTKSTDDDDEDNDAIMDNGGDNECIESSKMVYDKKVCKEKSKKQAKKKKQQQQKVAELPSFRKQKKSAHQLNFSDDEGVKNEGEDTAESEDLPMRMYRKSKKLDGGNDNESIVGNVGDDTAAFSTVKEKRRRDIAASTFTEKSNGKKSTTQVVGRKNEQSTTIRRRGGVGVGEGDKEKNDEDDSASSSSSRFSTPPNDNEESSKRGCGKDDDEAVTSNKNDTKLKNGDNDYIVDSITTGNAVVDENETIPANKKQTLNSSGSDKVADTKAESFEAVKTCTKPREEEMEEEKERQLAVVDVNNNAAMKDDTKMETDEDVNATAANISLSVNNKEAYQAHALPAALEQGQQQPQANDTITSTLPPTTSDIKRSGVQQHQQLLPPSNNWIEHLTNQITATTTEKFNSQREYYEAKLREQQQTASMTEMQKKYEEQCKENERLRNELNSERELNLENEIKISNLMQTIDMLRASSM